MVKIEDWRGKREDRMECESSLEYINRWLSACQSTFPEHRLEAEKHNWVINNLLTLSTPARESLSPETIHSPATQLYSYVTLISLHKNRKSLKGFADAEPQTLWIFSHSFFFDVLWFFFMKNSNHAKRRQRISFEKQSTAQKGNPGEHKSLQKWRTVCYDSFRPSSLIEFRSKLVKWYS